MRVPANWFKCGGGPLIELENVTLMNFFWSTVREITHLIKHSTLQYPTTQAATVSFQEYI